MQYLLLINGDEKGDYPDLMPAFMAYTQELRDAGAYVDGNRLQPADTATTVRVRDGETFITDGPFIETKETLGGYFLIEAESLDEALEWAAKIPSAPYGHVEVRPVVMRPAEVQA
jgi:hypothetical protein